MELSGAPSACLAWRWRRTEGQACPVSGVGEGGSQRCGREDSCSSFRQISLLLAVYVLVVRSLLLVNGDRGRENFGSFWDTLVGVSCTSLLVHSRAGGIVPIACGSDLGGCSLTAVNLHSRGSDRRDFQEGFLSPWRHHLPPLSAVWGCGLMDLLNGWDII